MATTIAFRVRTASLFLLLLLLCCRFLLADDNHANALLQQGRVHEAAVQLNQLITEQPDDSVAHQLLCRIYYAQEMADPAIHECQLAVSKDPSSSESEMWLGRAYGLKASSANMLAALGLAKNVHLSFERAVELDPENVQAMSDLGEYYVAAPSIVGGGLDKAQALAARMQPHFPSQAYRLLGLIAEKKKDTTAAEAEFKAAVAAGHTPEAYIDLGQFYQRNHQLDRMLAMLQSGVDADHSKGTALVDAASILTAAHSSPELAEELLRQYLTSSAKSDGAPAFKVHLQLGDLLAQRGDTAGAHHEYAAAASLAPDYAPARRAMQGS
jgi:tetratricopeptide (TPR) repeat protein